MQLYTWVRTTPVRCKLPWKCYDRTQGCYRTTTPAPLPSFPLPLLPVPPLPFSPSLYFPLPPFLLSPSLPPFPFPSLPCSEAARNPTKGSGAALWAPTVGPRKNFGYILSPEIVSGGNDFGSFFVLSNKYKFSSPATSSKCPPGNSYMLWAKSSTGHDAPDRTKCLQISA